MKTEPATVANLFSGAELPKGFAYPKPFLALIEKGVTNLAPWHIGGGQAMRDLRAGLAQRYPNQGYLPFAYRDDNEGRACWDVREGVIVHVHDGAAPGHERRAEFEEFEEWLSDALEDVIDSLPRSFA